MKHYRGYETIGNVFGQLFAKARDEVFKLGVRETYFGEDNSASWRAWSRGDRAESLALFHQDARYQSWIRQCQESKAKIIRGQLTEEPLHAYMQWNLSCVFQQYQQQGAEKVFTLSSKRYRQAIGSALPTTDIVIIDDAIVLQWECDPTGRVTGGWTWSIADGDDISVFLDLRSVFMKHATPLNNADGIM